jgi:hypothetical protein
MTSLNTKNDLNLPTYTDIEHYKLFRQAGQKLCDELAKKFLSKSVLKECGKRVTIVTKQFCYSLKIIAVH